MRPTEGFIQFTAILTLYIRLGQQKEGPLRGVMPTIRYLQRLGLDHFDLVLLYSHWVLESDPIRGMDVSSRHEVVCGQTTH